MEVKERKCLFNYSRNQTIFIVFLIYYLSHLISALHILSCTLLGLPTNPQPSPATNSLGYLLRLFYIYHATPLVLALLIFSDYRKEHSNRWVLPVPRLHHVLAGVILALASFTVASTILNGPISYFSLVGYRNLNLNVFLYSLTALYLLYVFRDERFFVSLFVITLGLLVIGELWELPLNYFGPSEQYPYFFIAVYLQRYIPIFFWFYLFRNIYKQFVRKQWFLIPPFAFAVTILTILTIEGIRLSIVNVIVSVTLHLAYALLLIFLPFQFYQKRVET